MGGEQLRPGVWARLILASGNCVPRKRARDQQADLAGAALKRSMLERLVALDPDPAALVTVLQQIVQEHGNAPGPARALAVGLRDDFQSAAETPQLLAWLIEQAIEQRSPNRH
jgi:hypothetical protein